VTKTKVELAALLNRYLFIEVHWEMLPEEDLLKLYAAFEQLRVEIEQVFCFVDEVTETQLTVIEDGKKRWREYTT
jgi:hypothetical protein